MSQTHIQIVIEFDKSLLNHFDVPQWNVFVAKLLSQGLIPPIFTPGEKPEPLSVLLDFRGLKRAHYRLDGIDLRLCWLQDADFSGSSLRNARLGCGRGISFRSARLHGADFRHVEISGCNFTDALGLDAAMFDAAAYDPANPPIGLPADILAVCKAETEPPTDRRQPSNPQEPTGFRQAPIRCHATIHLVPADPTHPTFPVVPSGGSSGR